VIKQAQELLKFRNLLTEEEAVCEDRIMEQFLYSTLTNYRFKRKGISHDRKFQKDVG
jgi:hypothetical protein